MAGKTVEITDANFDNEVLQSEVPVLLDFWAEWCGPCRMLAPTIEELSEEYDGKFKVGKLDTDNNRDTALKFNINAIPTLKFFKGGEEVDSLVGMTSKKDIKEKMEGLLT